MKKSLIAGLISITVFSMTNAHSMVVQHNMQAINTNNNQTAIQDVESSRFSTVDGRLSDVKETSYRGIAAVTGLSLDTSSVVRKRHTETQTSKSAYERWENVDGMFRLDCPERFAGKHVLLVDDVLTTGATTTACADAFRDVEGMCISVLTLAVTDY